MTRKALLMVTAGDHGEISVNVSGVLTPAELVFGLELIKKIVIENSQAHSPISISSKLDGILGVK